MSENLTDFKGNKIVKNTKLVDSEKVEEMMLEQLKEMRKKKPFETMNKLLGLTKNQYLETRRFEK